MTTFEICTLLLGASSALIAVAGFWVVYRTLSVLITQSELLRSSLDAQYSAGIATRQLEFDKILVDRPELQDYIYGNRDVSPGDEHYNSALAAPQLMANYMDTFYCVKGKYEQMWPDEHWESYIVEHVSMCPIVRRYVLARRSWYTRQFVAVCEFCERHQNATATVREVPEAATPAVVARPR